MSEIDLQSTPNLTFIDWKKPFVPSFVNHLLNEIGTDLSGKIIVVPTVDSGRRLRRSLAASGCVLAPRVVTPQFFLAERNSGKNVAVLSAWVDVLLDLDLDQARGIFPKDPPEGVGRSFRWAFNVGKQLSDLERSISETEKDFAEIGRMSASGPDGMRWADLAMLSERVEQTQRKWKVAQPDKYEQINSDAHIIIAAVSDLSNLVVKRISSLINNGAAVEVIVHCDRKLPHGFDDWGRPLASVWLEEPISYPDWKNNVKLCEKPTLLGQEVVSTIAREKWQPDQVSLGMCDRDLASAVSRELEQAGWDVYDPDGTHVKSSSLLQFLRCLRSWLDDSRPIEALINLLRLPQMDAFLVEGSPSRFSIIRAIDKIVDSRLILSTHDLVGFLEMATDSHARLHQCIQQFLTDTGDIFKGSSIKGLRGWVAMALNRSDEATATSVVDDINHAFNILEKIERVTKKVDLQQTIDILCEILSSKKVYGDATGAVIDLKGWMELVYEDADELLLLGLHEGAVPASGGDDAFLPDPMREMLGMETSQQKYARDSYLFKSLLQSRKHVRVYLSKLNESNVPNVVSRLLLRTSGQDLAQRVQRFFGESDVMPENPSAWRRD